MAGGIIFVIGGARSGKSGFALSRASSLPGKRAYIATAQAFDCEMEDRIRKHRDERTAEWETIEEPLRLAAVLGQAGAGHDVLLVDCLTLWLSNLILAEGEAGSGAGSIDGEIETFITTLGRFRAASGAPAGCSLFLVSNEVGLGIVPDNPLSRRFRDLAGLLNQRVAAVADEVYLVTAGIPLRIKP